MKKAEVTYKTGKHEKKNEYVKKDEYSVEEELGRNVLQTFQRNRIRLRLLQEQEKMLQETRCLYAQKLKERQKIDVPRNTDSMERRIVDSIFVRDEIKHLKEDVKKDEDMICIVINALPEKNTQCIRKLLKESELEDQDESESMETGDTVLCFITGNDFRSSAGQKKEFAKNLKRELIQFWNTYELFAVHKTPILEAKLIQIWKDYYDEMVARKEMSRKQEEELLYERFHLEVREMNRKMHLLKLIPELQSRVSYGLMGESIGYELSFIPKLNQKKLTSLIRRENACVTIKQAVKLRKLDVKEWSDEDRITEILTLM